MNLLRLLQSLEFEVVQLVAVLHNVALDLGGIDPGDKIFHVPCDKVGRVRDDIRTDSDML